MGVPSLQVLQVFYFYIGVDNLIITPLVCVSTETVSSTCLEGIGSDRLMHELGIVRFKERFKLLRSSNLNKH